jgi:GxxExxY protein
MKHGPLTERVIGAFYDVYNELGSGFLEAVYEEALAIVLHQAGLPFERQVATPVHFRGHRVGDYRADMIIDDSIVVEIKAVPVLNMAHEGQLLNYLRATRLEVGLLLNFGDKPSFKRKVFSRDFHRT